MSSVTLGARYRSLQGLVHTYQTLLRTNPILTKSVTSGIIACLGSSLSQLVSEGKVSARVSRSFLLFGTLITGPVTDHLYIALDKLFPGPGLASRILRVVTDRAVFSPAFVSLTLYCLARLQGGSHQQALDTTWGKLYDSMLANWKIWTIPQMININLVPAQYRVLFANLVALVWNFYLAANKS